MKYSILKPDADHPRHRIQYFKQRERFRVTVPEGKTPAEVISELFAAEHGKGSPRALVETFVAPYFAARRRIRPSTRKEYGNAIETFISWGRANSCYTVDQVTQEKLFEFRDYVCSVVGLQESTINKKFRNVNMFLGFMIDRKGLKNVTRAEAEVALRALEEPRKDRGLVDPVLLLNSFEDQPDEVQTFVRHLLLTGMRFSELLKLLWPSVNLREGYIHLDHNQTKTKKPRKIWLKESPSVLADLSRMANPYSVDRVYPNLNRWILDRAKDEVVRTRLMPHFTWQALRRTCGSYLSNAPGIYGGASALQSAQRLGHSVTIAEQRYIGSIRDIDPTATTLEDAMKLTKSRRK